MLYAEFLILLVIIFICSLAMSIAVERLAERWGANFAGSILLGMVTVLPEYMFVYFAVKKQEYSIALGSVCGAAAMLVTLGYGLVILSSTTWVSKRPVKTINLSKTTRIDAAYLFITAIIAVILGLIGDGLGLIDAVILTVIYVAYAVHLYLEALKKSQEHHEAGLPAAKVAGSLLTLMVCGIIVLVVSEHFVDSMKGISLALGAPPLAVAIVLSPIASEMPEKLTAFLTVHRNGALAEISICNFIGSKINHNSLLLAMLPFVALLYGYGAFFPQIVVPAFWLMTGLTIFAGISLSLGKLRQWQGWIFFLLFIVYVAVIIYFPQGIDIAHGVPGVEVAP